VVDYKNDRVYITSQNHGYAVETKSIDKDLLEVTQINLNDKTIEGLKHKTLDAFSVQYHPEASPGPNDTKFLFDDFYNLITRDDHAKR
jgi:carbamoyl-phosphate synthase small subunit